MAWVLLKLESTDNVVKRRLSLKRWYKLVLVDDESISLVRCAVPPKQSAGASAYVPGEGFSAEWKYEQHKNTWCIGIITLIL